MDSTQIAAAASAPLAPAQPHARIEFRSDVVPLVPASLTVGALLAIAFVDVPLAAMVKGGNLPDGIDKFLDAAEHFGTFYGHVLAFLLVLALDPERRRGLVRVALAAWSAGLAANVVKLCVARTRPKYFDFESLTAGHGFIGLFPGLSVGSRIQGFPSAHTATAVGFAIGLSYLYPRGRTVFLLIAALVGLQRIASASHFASDVLAGALVGWLIGHVWTSRNSLTSRLDSFEARTS